MAGIVSVGGGGWKRLGNTRLDRYNAAGRYWVVTVVTRDSRLEFQRYIDLHKTRTVDDLPLEHVSVLGV